MKPKATNGPAKQYNAIVEFITKKNFGVQVGHFLGYSELVALGFVVLGCIGFHL